MQALFAIVIMLLICHPAMAQSTKKKKAATNPALVKLDDDAKDKVKEWLKENCNDPSRLQFVSFGEPFNFYRWRIYAGTSEFDRDAGVLWRPFGDGGTAIYVKYRSTNTLGALILSERVFFINDSGKIFRSEEVRNIRRPSSDDGGDPAMEAFLKGF